MLTLLLLLTLASALPTSPPSSSSPLVVAHRGASGMRPEHTLAAYTLAAESGAAVVECDVVLSRDLVPVCSHEPWISLVSNVDRHDVGPPHADFSARRRELDVSAADEEPDLINDFFTFDFDLEELRSLRRRQVLESRDKSFDWQESFVTLHEYLELAQKHGFGIYPELKHSHLINRVLREREEDTTFERIVLDKLAEFGYVDRDDDCFLQTFEIQAVEDVLQLGTRLKLIYLVYRPESITDELLDKYQGLGVFGLGLPKDMIVTVDEKNHISHVDKELVQKIHERGMQVHVYTFRNEWHYMPFDFGHDPYLEYELFAQLGVDALFTDFPATMRRFIDTKINVGTDNNGAESSKIWTGF